MDVQLIADLHKSEVFSVGRHLGVPNDILVAPPSADLWYCNSLPFTSYLLSNYQGWSDR